MSTLEPQSNWTKITKCTVNYEICPKNFQSMFWMSRQMLENVLKMLLFGFLIIILMTLSLFWIVNPTTDTFSISIDREHFHKKCMYSCIATSNEFSTYVSYMSLVSIILPHSNIDSIHNGE